MDPRGKNTPLIIVTILACLVLLGGVNYYMTKANPTEDELQAQQQQQQEDAEKKAKIAASKAAASPSTPPTPSAPTKPSIGTGPSAPLPSELVIGNPATAKTKLAIGYTYDDVTSLNDQDALAVIQAAQTWATKHPGDSLQVVCVDLPADQLTNPADASVPIGISVNGTRPSAFMDNPGEGADTLAFVQTMLNALP